MRPHLSHRSAIRIGLLATIISAALALATLAYVLPARATALTVNTLADHPVDACNAECTLRDAIAEAGDGETIRFSVDGTITLTEGQLVVDKDLAIIGPGPKAENLIISGNDATRIFKLAGVGTRVTLSLLTLERGRVDDATEDDDGGGAILVGEFSLAPDPNLPELTLTDSQIRGNYAQGGGAGIRSYGNLTVLSSAIYSNTTEGDGGGIEVHTYAAVTNTTVVSNTTIVRNVASAGPMDPQGPDSNGGAIDTGGNTFRSSPEESDQGVFFIVNSTIVDNNADVGGGVTVRTNFVYMWNTILARNTANLLLELPDPAPDVAAFPDCDTEGIEPIPFAYTLQSRGYNLVGIGEGCEGLQSTDQQGTYLMPLDPGLEPLGDNGGPTLTQALAANSPALDTGSPPEDTNAPCPATDQRGYGRPAGSRCDVGAFEGNAQAPTATPTGTIVPATATGTTQPGASPTVTTTTEPGASPTATATGEPATTPTTTTIPGPSATPDGSPTATGTAGPPLTPTVTRTPGPPPVLDEALFLPVVLFR